MSKFLDEHGVARQNDESNKRTKHILNLRYTW